MRINELIVESQQIDELSLAGALGSAAKGAANVVGRAKGAWAGAKDVYNQRADRVANVAQRNIQKAGGYKAPRVAPTGTAPATQPTGTAPAPASTVPTASTAIPQTPTQQSAAPTQQPISVRQINQTIPTLRNRDLTSVKNTVDATVAKKMPTPAAAPQPTPAENPNIVQGTNENFKSNFLGMMI